MLYLYIIICVISILGIILIYRQNNIYKQYKIYKDQVEKLKLTRDELISSINDLNEKNTEVTNQLIKATKERENAMQRAAEAQQMTEQVLESEKRRLAAEVSRIKELEEYKMQQELEKKNEALNLLYTKNKEQITSEISILQISLDDFRARQDAINQAILRRKELEEREEFYSIQVSENNKEDIAVLQSMDLRLHNRDVIPKLIWELFIRRPTQEMIKRVTGGRDISGIYKITYKNTGEAYIGKTTSISTRWQNHIKTVIGLEGAARTTLHNRMAKDGLWNYTFEILEEVDKEHLSARESYYIDLYGTKKQLNMKSGDKDGAQ